MDIDRAGWSGEGAFTQTLVEALEQMGGIAFLRVEDAPATRSEADYNFISNEMYVTFATTRRREPGRRFGFLPGRQVVEWELTFEALEARLAALEQIGPPDYVDEGMIQYLRAERVVPPYQTRGYKLVEMVRIYEAGAEPRR